MPETYSKSHLRYSLNGCLLESNNFSFAKNTTYGCGGKAKIALFPENIQEARRAYDIAAKGKFIILGNGSNILASDKFYDGTVISTKYLSGIYKINDEIICCLSGTKISKLLNYCIQQGLGGLEYLYGIPATVGGAAFMNAGIRGRYIGDNILKVRLYNFKQFDLSKKECNFSYKQSTMRNINALILAVFLKVTPNCDKNDIIKNLQFYKERRKNLPIGRSCGCVFKNCGNISAGKIIQDCNLANFSLGSAKVSDKHCNFILNEGTTSAEVKLLIDFVKQKVYEKSSYKLEEEVIYIGDFNDSYG